MRNPISRFVAFLISSRLAQVLVLVHFILVVWAVRGMPLANPESWSWGGGCHGVPIADRTFFFCDATGILRLIGSIDFVGVVLFGVFETFFGWLLNGDFHVFSWVVAVVLLVVTSFQWMLVGACVQRLLWRFRRNAPA